MGLLRSSLVKSQPVELTSIPRPGAGATASGSVDVMIDPEVRPAAPSLVDAGPSTRALLERAAALGPVRATWESFVLPSDPVLGVKMQPHVAERRARFRRVVKATLGACLALCAVSLVATALGGGEAQAAAAPANGRAIRSKVVTTVEKMDDAPRGKAVTAPRAATPTPTRRAATVAAKRR